MLITTTTGEAGTREANATAEAKATIETLGSEGAPTEERKTRRRKPPTKETAAAGKDGGATSAIQLVGHVFISSSRDELIYAAENHTSVVGLRNVAWLRGGDVHVLVEEEKSTTGWTSVTLMNPGESTPTTTTKTKWWFRR